MNLIAKVDDFLIDRVFQRIADNLDRWVSCYGIAAFLMTGFALEQIAYRILRQSNLIEWLWYLWIPFVVADAYKRERSAKVSDILPPRRWFDRFMRCTLVFLTWILGAFSAIPLPTDKLIDRINLVAWAFYTVSLYFMACCRKPPRRQAVRLGIWRFWRTV